MNTIGKHQIKPELRLLESVSTATCWRHTVVPTVIAVVGIAAIRQLTGALPLILVAGPIAWSTTIAGLRCGLMTAICCAVLCDALLIEPFMSIQLDGRFLSMLASFVVSAVLSRAARGPIQRKVLLGNQVLAHMQRLRVGEKHGPQL